MGADPEAILFYGFPLPALNVSHLDLNDGWADDHKPPKPEDRSDYHTPEWKQWRERLHEWERTLENVEVEWSGSENCEQYFIHCAGIQKRVEWNELHVISVGDLEVPLDARGMLHKFCDRFNLPKAEPQWHLAARYF